MRTAQWLFIVSAALFVCGIGFVVVGAREARKAPAAAPDRPAMVPIASVKQLMNGIVGPSAGVIFNAVSTTVTAKGVEEVKPTTDEAWAVVGGSAAALAEAGNLMMLDGRAVDKGDWMKMSQAMVAAGQLSLKAIDAKDTEALLAAGEAVNMSCDNCHRRYMRQ